MVKPSCTKANACNTEKVCRDGMTLPNTRDNGNTDNSRVRAGNTGLTTILGMMVVGRMGLSMAKGNRLGKMEAILMGIGYMMLLKEKALISGQILESIGGSGRIISYMVKEFSTGLMGDRL